MTFSIFYYWSGTKVRFHKHPFTALGTIVLSEFGHSQFSQKLEGTLINTIHYLITHFFLVDSQTNQTMLTNAHCCLAHTYEVL